MRWPFLFLETKKILRFSACEPRKGIFPERWSSEPLSLPPSCRALPPSCSGPYYNYAIWSWRHRTERSNLSKGAILDVFEATASCFVIIRLLSRLHINNKDACGSYFGRQFSGAASETQQRIRSPFRPPAGNVSSSPHRNSADAIPGALVSRKALQGFRLPVYPHQR